MKSAINWSFGHIAAPQSPFVMPRAPQHCAIYHLHYLRSGPADMASLQMSAPELSTISRGAISDRNQIVARGSIASETASWPQSDIQVVMAV
jgi:hypothetical protein